MQCIINYKRSYNVCHYKEEEANRLRNRHLTHFRGAVGFVWNWKRVFQAKEIKRARRVDLGKGKNLAGV